MDENLCRRMIQFAGGSQTGQRDMRVQSTLVILVIVVDVIVSVVSLPYRRYFSFLFLFFEDPTQLGLRGPGLSRRQVSARDYGRFLALGGRLKLLDGQRTP